MNEKRSTQFKGYAKALFDELQAIEVEGLKNSWNNLDVYRRQREAIARRAYDLVDHAIGSMEPIDLQCCASYAEVVHSIPDLTELPKEQAD